MVPARQATVGCPSFSIISKDLGSLAARCPRNFSGHPVFNKPSRSMHRGGGCATPEPHYHPRRTAASGFCISTCADSATQRVCLGQPRAFALHPPLDYDFSQPNDEHESFAVRWLRAASVAGTHC